ncbi:fimbrial protein [Escherichia coli]|nr:fimbrial protein [Escherichia coli]MDA6637277.1 fimbrial protein [Escherichia coli]MDA6660707.1 fimbrial protein [Escherichia coli]
MILVVWRFRGPVYIVSENKTIEIAFNEVIISDISGDNYKREVPYSVECDSENTDTGIQMKLTWTGVETDFNDSAVETDVVGLGVELQQNGQRFQQGKAINISKTNLPKLHAVLVKKSGAVLSEGAFEAYATLQVDYQ